MKRGLCWAVRFSWAVLGGAWGVWLGLGGYLRLADNADSFASLLAMGFFSMLGWVGLLVGMATSALIGVLVEGLLRRVGVGTAASLVVATVVNALALWLLVGLVQTAYPGLGGGNAGKPVVRPGPAAPATRNTCASPAPIDPRERAIWNTECR